MGNSVRLRALALVTAGIVGSWSWGAAALADPPADHAEHADQGRHLGQAKDQRDDHAGARGDGARHGQGHAHGQGAQGGRGPHAGPRQTPGHAGHQGTAHAAGDPAGNNGTVKIAGPGDAVGHPSNNPHPGCTFVVEWFGFDQGADVVSTVTLTPQAPTSDVVLGGTAPGEVFVGGDPAGGGTDLDGRQAYTVTFQGEPHPQQGFHVKLSVATPRSLGNDTKTKVFWVAPCAEADEGAAGGAGGSEGSGTEASGVTSDAAAGTGQGVLGETYAAESDSDAAVAAAGAGDEDALVPTAVDAGEDGVLPSWARSPLPLTLISGALVLIGAGIVLRNRSRA